MQLVTNYSKLRSTVRRCRREWLANWKRPFIPFLYPLFDSGILLFLGGVTLIAYRETIPGISFSVFGLLCLVFWWTGRMPPVAEIPFKDDDLNDWGAFEAALNGKKLGSVEDFCADFGRLKVLEDLAILPKDQLFADLLAPLRQAEVEGMVLRMLRAPLPSTSDEVIQVTAIKMLERLTIFDGEDLPAQIYQIAAARNLRNLKKHVQEKWPKAAEGAKKLENVANNTPDIPETPKLP